MYKIILNVFLLTLISLTLNAQKFTWEDYLPGKEVDFIVFLSTNKAGPLRLTEKDYKALSENEIKDFKELNTKIEECFYSSHFPLKHYSDYMEVYELKEYLNDPDEIKKIVQYFPKVTCDSIPRWRCKPEYRDCIIFYKNQTPIAAIKMCFSCTAVDATPTINEARCLANKPYLKNIIKEWLKRGLIDLYKRG